MSAPPFDSVYRERKGLAARTQRRGGRKTGDNRLETSYCDGPALGASTLLQLCQNYMPLCVRIDK
jgi:hypothetical protein